MSEVPVDPLLLRWRKEQEEARRAWHSELEAMLRQNGIGWVARPMEMDSGGCGCGGREGTGGNLIPEMRMAAEIWQEGDAFPSQTTPCGWTLEDRAIPLLDPNPCVLEDGTVESNLLGYAFGTGTTQTIQLPTGQYRMYFASGTLNQYTTSNLRVWPAYDGSNTRLKFNINRFGFSEDPETNPLYWKATGDDYTNLHFSNEFIGYIDSTNGIEFPMYAPWVEPISVNCSYAGATATVSNPATNFWAGWHCTAIRSTLGSLVYRDPSVLHIKSLSKFFNNYCLMESL